MCFVRGILHQRSFYMSPCCLCRDGQYFLCSYSYWHKIKSRVISCLLTAGLSFNFFFFVVARIQESFRGLLQHRPIHSSNLISHGWTRVSSIATPVIFLRNAQFPFPFLPKIGSLTWLSEHLFFCFRCCEWKMCYLQARWFLLNCLYTCPALLCV